MCPSLFGQIDSAVYDIEQYRQKQENEFRDPEKSPLDKKSRKKFKGLNYFPHQPALPRSRDLRQDWKSNIVQDEDHNFKATGISEIRRSSL